MKRIILAITLLAFTMTGVAIASDEMGGVKTLRPNSMFKDNVNPVALKYKGEDPGSNKLLPRGYNGAPPQIPHSIEGFAVEIGNNECLSCHDVGADISIPATHVKAGKLNLRRFQCVQCHVPQTNVKTLVKNENDRFVAPKK